MLNDINEVLSNVLVTVLLLLPVWSITFLVSGAYYMIVYNNIAKALKKAYSKAFKVATVGVYILFFIAVCKTIVGVANAL